MIFASTHESQAGRVLFPARGLLSPSGVGRGDTGLPSRIRSFRHIDLRLVQDGDAALIVWLRTHPEKGRYLHPTQASVAAQREWIRNYQQRERDGDEYYFVASDRASGDAAGTIRLYDIHGGTFTMGSWVTAPGATAWASIESLLAGYDYGFHTLGLNTCLYEVMEGNTRVWEHQISFGAEILERRDGFVWFSLSRTRYEAIRQRYKRCYLTDASDVFPEGGLRA